MRALGRSRRLAALSVGAIVLATACGSPRAASPTEATGAVAQSPEPVPVEREFGQVQVDQVDPPPTRAGETVAVAGGSGTLVFAATKKEPLSVSSMWIQDVAVGRGWLQIEPPFPNVGDMIVSSTGATVFAIQDRCVRQREIDGTSIVCEEYTARPAVASMPSGGGDWSITLLPELVQEVRRQNELFLVMPVGDAGVVVEVVNPDDPLQATLFYVPLGGGAASVVANDVPSVLASCDNDAGRFFLLDTARIDEVSGQTSQFRERKLIKVGGSGEVETVLDGRRLDEFSVLGDELFIFCDQEAVWIAGERADDNTVQNVVRLDPLDQASAQLRFPEETYVLLTEPLVAAQAPGYDVEKGRVAAPVYMLDTESWSFTESAPLVARTNPPYHSFQADSLAFLTDDRLMIEIVAPVIGGRS